MSLRRSEGNVKVQIDGVLVVDKPDGITSMDVVRTVKRRFMVKKAGHLGTLDPFATGVLPVILNEATKLVPFLVEESKEYEATLKLGEETNTDDPTGEILSRGAWNEVTSTMIECAFEPFVGLIEQMPPMFSAIKVQGTPLYRLARKGLEVERKKRTVEIFSLQIESISLPLVHFKVSCSKGTYIRTLARDIGRKIGCGGHLIRLRRLRNGPFTLERAVSWNTLTMCSGPRVLQPWLIDMRGALDHLPEIIGDEGLVNKIRFGRQMMVRDLPSQALSIFGEREWVKVTSPRDDWVAILRSEIRGMNILSLDPDTVALRPLRVFHSPKEGGREMDTH
jgi:tRNA pseudouridine55 synthase